MIKKLTLSIVAISALSVSIFAKDLSIDEKVKAIYPKRMLDKFSQLRFLTSIMYPTMVGIRCMLMWKEN